MVLPSQFMKKIMSLNNFFLLVIFCLPLYLIRVDFLGLPTNVFELMAILAILFWGIENRKTIFDDFFCLPKLLILSFGFTLVGILLSILCNDSYLVGLGILKSWFIIPILFSFALYTRLKQEVFLEKVYSSLYLSVALVGLVALVYKILGIVTYDGRLQAFYSSPNFLAMYLVPGFFFGMYFLVKPSSQYKKRFSLLINLFFLAIILISLGFTYSYGAWIFAIISILITFLFFIPNKKLFVAATIFAILFSIFIYQTNTQKYLGLFSERSSFVSRITIWKSSFLMIRENIFLGIGPGNFQNKYLALQKHFPPYLEWAVPQPHNIFLAFWLQAGILGLFGFLLLLFFVFRTLIRIMKNKKNIFLAMPLFVFFLYTVLHGFVDTPYWKNDLSFLFWICVFLSLTIRYHKNQE